MCSLPPLKNRLFAISSLSGSNEGNCKDPRSSLKVIHEYASKIKEEFSMYNPTPPNLFNNIVLNKASLRGPKLWFTTGWGS